MQDIPYVIHSCRYRLLDHVAAGDRLVPERIDPINLIGDQNDHAYDRCYDPDINDDRLFLIPVLSFSHWSPNPLFTLRFHFFVKMDKIPSKFR